MNTTMLGSFFIGLITFIFAINTNDSDSEVVFGIVSFLLIGIPVIYSCFKFLLFSIGKVSETVSENVEKGKIKARNKKH